MITKEYCKQKYMEFKGAHRRIPLRKEFVKFAQIPNRRLEVLYSRDAYSKLQQDCGDEANKLSLERTPKEKIMRQYGDLVLEGERAAKTIRLDWSELPTFNLWT